MQRFPSRNAVAVLLVCSTTAAAVEVDFQRDIRPLLSDACFQCHGADEAVRQAELRLDMRSGLLATDPDRAVVVPGRPQDSELIRRVMSDADDLRMPPPDSERQLTPPEIDRLVRWVQQGAVWQEHWAFVPPQQPPLPQFDISSRAAVSFMRPQNPIDLFVLQQLGRAQLTPSRPATRSQLARRLALTLTGLPPTPDEVSQLMADSGPDAYERFVDRLLASPRYGERAALVWLDLARYADTDGYQDDQPRVMWRWRDWLLDALNRGLPFDQFSIEMLAGDLLPAATDWQRLATGFHRNHRTNGEGGSIPEEFRVEYVVDCVDTTSTVWLGLTLGCCRCHDHKYDPFTQRDFYRLFAFFNNTPEKGVYRGNNSPPLIRVPTARQQYMLALLDRQIEQAEGDETQRTQLRQQRSALLGQVPTTMVMAEGTPRDTYLMARGQYDQPTVKVTAGVPQSLPALPAEAPRNRLGLSQWLFGQQNPLTARVAVNRIWSMHFGTGLVRTPEDFGAQGAPPTHPELLDWLAAKFVHSGWDTKALHRLIVTSATYRQSSVASAKPRRLDPENRLYWRFPRRRLEAEMIRDRALAVSGLLVERLGGPSVKPYQPAGLWNEIAGGSTSAYKDGYQRSSGADLYRRSLYTFWRRTIPPPGMTTFDAPSRETCSARRPRTNTPLQALSLLNDITYLEAARALAERMLASGSTPYERVTAGFELALSRDPTSAESLSLQRAYQHFRREFKHNQKAAAQLLDVGASSADTTWDPVELAACMSIGNVLLNLDEFVIVE